MSRVGEKYIIEIDEEFMGFKNELYKIKGFNSLVFDDNGLNKLTKYEDVSKTEAYSRGYEAGFKKGADAEFKVCNEIIDDIVAIGKDKDFLKNMYSKTDFWEVLKSQSLKDIVNNYFKYKNTKTVPVKVPEEVHIYSVGDVVKAPGCNKAIITMLSGTRCHVIGKNFKGDVDLCFVEYLGEHKDLFD